MKAGNHQSKWNKFDQIGMLEVLEVIGLLAKNPNGGGKLKCRQWFYRVECSCGRVETRGQKHLIGASACSTCSRSVGQANGRRWNKTAEEAPDSVEEVTLVDFTSLRWGSVHPMPLHLTKRIIRLI